MEITTERRYHFPVDPEALWSTIDRTDDYQAWWPWLRAFDAQGLRVGDRWDCVIRPPLPYLVRISLALTAVERPGLVAATIDGDLVGRAHLTVHDHPHGSEVRLASSLAPRRSLLRAFATAAPSLARYGHGWVLDTGARQLAALVGAAR
jgi:polyketide cyclase/dehydrase/lipid transport protein